MRRSPTSGTTPRVSALYATRSWILLLLLTVAWVLAAMVGAGQFSALAPVERACLLGGACCIATAWLFRNHDWALVLLVGAPALLVVAASLSQPGTSAAWIALSSSVSQVSFGFVLLTNRWVGLVGVGVCVAALAGIWSQRPSNVLPGVLVIANGWIGLAAIAASSLALWLAWHRQLRQARIVDRRLATWENITDSAREQQQRARLWREAVAQVHETLLTTIRYVLQTPEVDPSGLVSWRSRQESSVRRPADWRESVAQATAARIGAGIVEMDESLADLPINTDLREPVRAAVFEGVSNAVRHGGASRVRVTGGVDGAGIWIRVADNGSGLQADALPGLGWSEVLSRQLGGIGGSWTIAHSSVGTELTLRIPLPPSSDLPTAIDDGFEQGRILMTWPLLALSLVSVIYSAYLPLAVTGAFVVGLLLALGITVGMWAIVSANRPAVQARPFLALSVSVIPWVLLVFGQSDPSSIAQTTVVQASALAALLQAAGYTVIALGLWSRVRVAVTGLVIWGSGAMFLALAVPAEQRTPVLVALANCLVVMPIVGGVSRIGTRRFASAQRIVQEERSRIMLEAARAEVSRWINASLESCVGETNAIIDEIALTGAVTPEQRCRLSMLDGLIRATIQVDPVLNGGFAQAGSELVVRGFQSGSSFDVRMIDASQDMRPLERDLLDHLAELAASCDVEGRLQVFHDDIEDFLVLTLRWSHPSRVANGALERLAAWHGVDGDHTAPGQQAVVDVHHSGGDQLSGSRTELTVTVARRSQVAVAAKLPTP